MCKYPGAAPTLIGIGAVVALISLPMFAFIYFFHLVQPGPGEFVRKVNSLQADPAAWIFFGGMVSGLCMVIFGIVWGWIHRSLHLAAKREAER